MRGAAWARGACAGAGRVCGRGARVSPMVRGRLVPLQSNESPRWRAIVITKSEQQEIDRAGKRLLREVLERERSKVGTTPEKKP